MHQQYRRYPADLWQPEQSQIVEAPYTSYFWQNATNSVSPMSLVNEIPPHCRLSATASDTTIHASLRPPCTPPSVEIPWGLTPSTTCPLVPNIKANFDRSTGEAPKSYDLAALHASSQTAHTRPLDGPASTPSLTVSSLSAAHSHGRGWICSSDEISSSVSTVQQPLPLFPRLDMSQIEHTTIMHPLPVPTASLHASVSYPRMYPLGSNWASNITQNAADAAPYPPCYTHDSAAHQPIQSASYSNTLQGTATDMHWAQGHSPQLEYSLPVKYSCSEMAMRQSSPPVSGVSADPTLISANDHPQRPWANGHTLVARRRSYPDSSQPALGYPCTSGHRRLGTLTDTPYVLAKHHSPQFLLQQRLSNVPVNDSLYSKAHHSAEASAPIHHALSSSRIASHLDVPYTHPETLDITVPSQSYTLEGPPASQPHLGIPIMTRPNPPFPPVSSDSSATMTATSTATTSAPSSHCPHSVGPSRVGQGDTPPPAAVHQPTAEELKKQRLKDRRFVIACSFCKGRKIRCKPLQPSVIRERATAAVTFWSNEKNETPLDGEKPAGLDLPPCANCIRRGTPCHYPLRKEKRAPPLIVPPNERPFIPGYSGSSVSGTPRSTSGSSQAFHSPNGEKRVAI